MWPEYFLICRYGPAFLVVATRFWGLQVVPTLLFIDWDDDDHPNLTGCLNGACAVRTTWQSMTSHLLCKRTGAIVQTLNPHVFPLKCPSGSEFFKSSLVDISHYSVFWWGCPLALFFDSVKTKSCLLIPSLQCWSPNETLVFCTTGFSGMSRKTKSRKRFVKERNPRWSMGGWDNRKRPRQQSWNIKGGWIQSIFYTSVSPISGEKSCVSIKHQSIFRVDDYPILPGINSWIQRVEKMEP